MIFLSGYSSSGKTEVGKILEQEGFWVVDSGPFWRKITNIVAPNMSTGEFHFMMREYTGEPTWEDSAFAAILRNSYERGFHVKKDLVVAGYRNLNEANFVQSKLEKYVFPTNRKTIIFINAAFEISFQRYKERENSSISLEDFKLYREDERVRGIEEFRKASDYIIDNSGDLQTLEFRTKEIVYNQLGYPTDSGGKRFVGKLDQSTPRIQKYFEEKGFHQLGSIARPIYRNSSSEKE